MFDHTHLPNIGLTEGNIPLEIYQALNKEIVDIHNDDSNTMKMNRTLAGQITKEYQITQSRQLLDPYLEEMGRAYQNEWNYYPKENPNDNNLTVESVWVNMQKKLEVNPLHNHLPNLGFTEGNIPPEIYQALNKEIVDIHNDDSNILKMNNTLAGQITKEYQLSLY